MEDHAQITSYRPREVNTGRTAHLAHDIEMGKYDQIWVSTPSTRLIREQRWHAHVATLTKWVTLATAATALFFVVGPDNGQWQEPEVQAMVADLPGAMKKYALCQFDKSVGPLPAGTRSGARIACFTNANIGSLPCTCDKSIKHIQDWKMDAPSVRPGQKREELITHVAKHIVGQVGNQKILLRSCLSVDQSEPNNTNQTTRQRDDQQRQTSRQETSEQEDINQNKQNKQTNEHNKRNKQRKQ